MEDDAKQFIENLENRFGGPVGYRTYSTWFASEEGVVREFGVFIFEINGKFHYEDFERKPSLFGFAIKPRKSLPPYVKLEGSFSASSIKSITVVTKSQALSCAQGMKKQEMIAPANGLQRIFSPLVTRVVLSDGPAMFFELINHKEFTKAIKEGMDGRVQGV
ncbi:MAG: hypothetical protein PHG30_09605 [Eubacteriales bacterium]|nr:hypothetical protein [Eubacteriales bacterium]MDD3823672.1 hypothetical protein [Sphaerochaetaceae bacterium]